jgi:fused signal recognition particle receptor
MAEKKSGFFGRLFSGTNPAPETEKATKPQATKPEAELPEGGEAAPSSPVKTRLETPPFPGPSTEDLAGVPEAGRPDAPPPETVPEPAPAAPLAEASPPDVPAAPPPEPQPIVEAAPRPEPKPASEKKGWFTRLRDGLSRSSSQLGQSITGIFTKRRLDQAMLDDLEDALLSADLGLETAMAITDALARDRFDKDIAPDEVRAVLASEVEKVLAPVAEPLAIDRSAKPFVVLVVGVNGSGKTTTIGKLAHKFRAEGLATMIAAGDTFRAAAIEQLKVWGERTATPVIARPQGSDASGLAFDAMTAARDAAADVLLIDTAGRLQNKAELMAELEKIVRVLKKQDEAAPHSVLLVLDATTGQNALQQAEIFGRTAGVTGLAMTKLDGTAKGGILVAISAKHKLPVHFIGVGEGVDDLQPFDAKDFAEAIAGTAE